MPFLTQGPEGEQAPYGAQRGRHRLSGGAKFDMIFAVDIMKMYEDYKVRFM